MRRFDVMAAGLMVLDILAAPVNHDVFDVDTVYPEHLSFSTGGDMLNAAMNLRKLDARVAIAGTLGGDDAGKMLLSQIDRYGLDRESVHVLDDVPTPVTIALCEPGGERHFIHRRGANDHFDGAQLTAERLAQAQILYIGSAMGLKMLEGEALRRLFARAHAAGTVTIMDAASSRDGRWLEKVEAALPETDVFFPSFIEANKITGLGDPEAQAAFFVERGVKLAGVKLGAEGCVIDEGGRIIRVKAIPHENPIDMTGAGDAFIAGFMKGLLLGFSALRAAQLGCAIAHESIGSVGATTHQATLNGVLKKAQTHYGAG